MGCCLEEIVLIHVVEAMSIPSLENYAIALGRPFHSLPR
jgi:hypothetical protein